MGSKAVLLCIASPKSSRNLLCNESMNLSKSGKLRMTSSNLEAKAADVQCSAQPRASKTLGIRDTKAMISSAIRCDIPKKSSKVGVKIVPVSSKPTMTSKSPTLCCVSMKSARSSPLNDCKTCATTVSTIMQSASLTKSLKRPRSSAARAARRFLARLSSTAAFMLLALTFFPSSLAAIRASSRFRGSSLSALFLSRVCTVSQALLAISTTRFIAASHIAMASFLVTICCSMKTSRGSD